MIHSNLDIILMELLIVAGALNGLTHDDKKVYKWLDIVVAIVFGVLAIMDIIQILI